MSKLNRLLMASATGLALALLAGCGGTELDDDYGYDPGAPSYPQYRYLTIALRVTDGGGRALGGATVYVDGVANGTLSADQYYPLDNHYPHNWQGWAANWESDEYRVVINYPGDQDRFEIRVTKPGWTADSTMVTIHDWEPTDIYIRDVMTLWEVQTGGARAQAAHSTEVLPLAPQAGRQPANHSQGIVIVSSDDAVKAGETR